MPFPDGGLEIGQGLLVVGSPSERKYDTFCVPEPLSLPASSNASIAVMSAAS
jgi:hypothetical protein